MGPAYRRGVIDIRVVFPHRSLLGDSLASGPMCLRIGYRLDQLCCLLQTVYQTSGVLSKPPPGVEPGTARLEVSRLQSVNRGEPVPTVYRTHPTKSKGPISRTSRVVLLGTLTREGTSWGSPGQRPNSIPAWSYHNTSL